MAPIKLSFRGQDINIFTLLQNRVDYLKVQGLPKHPDKVFDSDTSSKGRDISL